MKEREGMPTNKNRQLLTSRPRRYPYTGCPRKNATIVVFDIALSIKEIDD
jgi:hypothetical protein